MKLTGASLHTQVWLKAVEILGQELQRDDLQAYTVCRMAKRDVAEGMLVAALQRLQVDADKLRCHNTIITELLSIK